MRQHERGEIATLLTVGTLVVIGVTAVVSSLFVNNKQGTSSRAMINCHNYPVDDCPVGNGCKVSGSSCVTDYSYNSSSASSRSSSSSRQSSSRSSSSTGASSSTNCVTGPTESTCPGQGSCRIPIGQTNAGYICCASHRNPSGPGWGWATWSPTGTGCCSQDNCAERSASSSSGGGGGGCPASCPNGPKTYGWNSFTQCVCTNCKRFVSGTCSYCGNETSVTEEGSHCCPSGWENTPARSACENYFRTHSSASSSSSSGQNCEYQTTAECNDDENCFRCEVCGQYGAKCTSRRGASSSSSSRSSSSSSSYTGYCNYVDGRCQGSCGTGTCQQDDSETNYCRCMASSSSSSYRSSSSSSSSSSVTIPADCSTSYPCSTSITDDCTKKYGDIIYPNCRNFGANSYCCQTGNGGGANSSSSSNQSSSSVGANYVDCSKSWMSCFQNATGCPPGGTAYAAYKYDRGRCQSAYYAGQCCSKLSSDMENQQNTTVNYTDGAVTYFGCTEVRRHVGLFAVNDVCFDYCGKNGLPSTCAYWWDGDGYIGTPYAVACCQGSYKK